MPGGLFLGVTTKISRLQWARHQGRWFGKWHVYLGIIAGFIVSIVGVTGSILVFENEIDRALNPKLFTVLAQQHKMSFAEIIPVVRRNYPGLQIDYIYNEHDSPVAAYRISTFKTKTETFINPYTGTICGKRIQESSFIHVVTEIHRTLLVPVAGRYIVGISSLILFILTITGLRMWVPKKWKQLKSVLTVNFKAGFKRQNYDWHNVLGFYSSPVVLLLSLTGFCFTFSMIVIPMLFVLSGKSPQGVGKLLGAKSAYTAGVTPLPLQNVLVIGEATMPGSRIAGLSLPNSPMGNYRMDMLSKGLPKSGKREMLIVDQYTGKILLNSRTDFPNIGNAYLSWLGPVHFGSFGGLPTKILAVIGGLMPLALFITGFVIWYPRWKKQKKIAAKRLSEEEIEAATEAHVAEHDRLSSWQYSTLNLRKGFRYALWFILFAALAGALYGLFSGVIVQPAVFAVAFTCVLVVIHFVLALLCILFNMLFLAPFKKGSRMLIRYFSLSLSFLVVFLFFYWLLVNTGMKIF
jgi:uncharacterized iron-regulated membrane protein